MDKVGLTETLHAGGMPLKEAMRTTDRVLRGETVVAHLPACEATQTVVERLDALGVDAEARHPTPSPSS